jgi:signal transduction histidine kinase
LISNAIKFSQPGGKIQISAQEKDTNTVLTVRDFGIGIPAEILEKIFSSSAATSRSGTNGEQHICECINPLNHNKS